MLPTVTSITWIPEWRKEVEEISNLNRLLNINKNIHIPVKLLNKLLTQCVQGKEDHYGDLGNGLEIQLNLR